MKKVLIIGGGLAGLSAASFLASKNFSVEIIEASPKCGGRVNSFKDKTTNQTLDNGQHLLMGCYDYTLELLKLADATDNFEIQKNLDVTFIKPEFSSFHLSANDIFYPFNLISAFLKYTALSLRERLSILKFFLTLLIMPAAKISSLTAAELIQKSRQSQNCQNAFWDLILVSAFNAPADCISAQLFQSVMKQIFFSGKSGASLIIPKYPLQEAFCKPLQKFIEKHNGEICLSERAVKLICSQNKVKSIITDKRTISNFDFIISAIPSFALNKITSEGFDFPNYELGYSVILNVHVWLKKNELKKNFYALIGSPVHWVFNKGNNLNVVISSAEKYAAFTSTEILNIISDELNKYFQIPPEMIIHHRIVKEKRATFIPDVKSVDQRPDSITDLDNLFLAGDWIDTGLPSTIESAVKSGWLAFQAIESRLRSNN